MADKLMRVNRKRGGGDDEYINAPDSMHEARVIGLNVKSPLNGDGLMKIGEFFLIKSIAVDQYLRYLAEQNPGCDVEVYDLERVGHCPAGEFTVKSVSDKGILPV